MSAVTSPWVRVTAMVPARLAQSRNDACRACCSCVIAIGKICSRPYSQN